MFMFIESMCLVKECREVEEHLGTHFMVEILGKVECSHRHMKEVVRRYDRLILADLCRVNAPCSNNCSGTVLSLEKAGYQGGN